MPENTRHFIPLALTIGVPRSLPPGAHSLVEEPRCKQNKSRARQRSGLCLESLEKLQGCSCGRLWSQAPVDCDPGSWALTADRCTFLMLETGALAAASSCRSLGWGPHHSFLPSSRWFRLSPATHQLGAHPNASCSFQDSPEAGGEREEDQEREEEQAFLVSLYKFMKERHTPIERVPHLGFKQSASLGCRQGGGAR